ncbi:MAG: hypothetical protein LLG37_06430 [Spirochaetia bacterium]|nr:hypothetical protein [Spirochaetia bacterium]
MEWYKRALISTPAGTFVRKEIHGNHYYYLAVRLGDDVRFIYKGKKITEAEIDALNTARKQRKNYKELIKKLKIRIKYLERILKGSGDM